MSSAPEPAVAIDASEAPLRAKQTGYPAALCGARGRPREAPAGRSLRPHQLRRQPDAPRAGMRVVAFAMPHQAGRVHLHPARPSGAGDERRRDRARARACARASRQAAGDAHQLVNPGPTSWNSWRSGTARATTTVEYPDDDLAAKLGADGKWHYYRKDGTPY